MTKTIQSPAGPAPDTTAETALLGAILADYARVMPAVNAAGITTSDFYSPDNRRIFAAMLELTAAGAPIDTLTVSRKTGMQLIGLDAIMQSCPTPTHTPHYLQKVLDAAQRRHLVEIGAELQDAATSDRPADEIAAEVRERLEDISGKSESMEPVNAASWAIEQVDPPDQILDELFDAGTKAVIVAPSKARKSFFMLQMAITLAGNKSEFLGWRIPKQRRVLFWNLEITPAHFHKRLTSMLRALDMQPHHLGDRLRILNSRGADIGLIQIITQIRRRQIEILFIDPIYKLIPGDESGQEEIKRLLRDLDRLCRETGVAVVYSHHTAKGISGDRQTIDRASGSGVLARDFDAMISLVPHVNEGMLVVEQIARSYPPRDAFSIEFNTDQGCFMVADGVAPVCQTSNNRSRSGRTGNTIKEDDVLALVAERPLPALVFRSELRRIGLTERAARETRARLVDTGQLVEYSPPTYPRQIVIGTPDAIEILQRSNCNGK